MLLDIRLPGIDGWAVLQALQADPETRGIPVIVVSIVDERARGVAMGAAGYLVKPIGREKPAGRVRGRRRARADGRHRSRSRGPRSMTQTRILVVEDNPKNLKLVRDVLTHSGYEVVEATSGEDGVRLATRCRRRT